ncbi:30S ribosomal protein S17e [uncultured archaeon]|nr:30S ribosomal protein S17e [uncultured archaeon]
MGRIKTKMIKRLTFDLIKQSRERFTKQFEDNKKVVRELLGNEASKKIRNSVAGYVTRLMKVVEE